jgi:hypothetical protein
VGPAIALHPRLAKIWSKNSIYGYP